MRNKVDIGPLTFSLSVIDEVLTLRKVEALMLIYVLLLNEEKIRKIKRDDNNDVKAEKRIVVDGLGHEPPNAMIILKFRSE
ncbi:unnamed protein product [Dovyalis caffra]|uniref:Uncharacterized protein n=1 Tax=Dovyalis caffra TaxID=77055 RepID=A0AAV1SRX9_9ROSI|nr:unnamed protein product [Dovyalis caffra]